MAGEENFDTAVKEIASGRIVRTDGLSVSAFAAAIEPGGKNAGVVEDDEVARPQQNGKVTKFAVGPLSGGALHVQHAGSVTGSKRFLGNEFVGKMEVEIGNQHKFRL